MVKMHLVDTTTKKTSNFLNKLLLNFLNRKGAKRGEKKNELERQESNKSREVNKFKIGWKI